MPVPRNSTIGRAITCVSSTSPGPPGRSSRYVRDVDVLEGLGRSRRLEAAAVAERYPFLANEHYLGIVDWDDPLDPIARLIVPDPGELGDFGSIDASAERTNTVMRGLQHKYADTVLVLCTDTCGGQCRYCFRKRLFMPGNEEAVQDLGAAVAYIEGHPEVTSVLLTGGDPLTMPTSRLAWLLQRLTAIDHVDTVRLGTKMPAFDPLRILRDDALLDAIAAAGRIDKRLYIVCHFDHPREFTAESIEALAALQHADALLVNQCPVIRGVNDSVDTLRELLITCTVLGCPQYYVFQMRPVVGNAPYVVPIVRGFSLFEEARSGLSGLSRRARYCMSHATGKIEVVGLDPRRIYARYHRARDPRDEGRMLVCRRDETACWPDDLEQVYLG